MQGIIGFEINVEKIKGVSKLLQNRNHEDYNNIINELSEQQEPLARLTAEVMRKKR